MLTIDRVTYAYDTVTALDDVSLAVEDGEILCLLGPSGCGKTTLLRVIAGLETGYTGIVKVTGEDMRGVPVHERDFGLMFQDFALFPHMNVEQNVAYGLKRQGFGRAGISQRVEAMLKRVGLQGFNSRDVNMLSGGQKQRVALARSLAPSPRLLMLDEPLGSLDALLRDELTVELRDIVKSVGLTSIYVTHDQKEAYAIADRVAVMNAGQIDQVDTPQKLYYKPGTQFVARFLGLMNIFKKDAHEMIESLIKLSSGDFSSANCVLIHPTGIYLTPHEEPPCAEFVGQVEQVVFRGEYYEISLKTSDAVVLHTTTRQTDVTMGDTLNFYIDCDCILPLI